MFPPKAGKRNTRHRQCQSASDIGVGQASDGRTCQTCPTSPTLTVQQFSRSPVVMTRRQRLMAILRGEPVDRPAVSFYEIGGFNINPADPDRFNIYNDPSWQPLLALAEEQTDLIRMRTAAIHPAPAKIGRASCRERV